MSDRSDMILACRTGDVTKVRQLIEDGADIHFSKEQPLFAAVIYGQLDVVKYLVENGADVCIERNYFKNWAIDNHKSPVATYLQSFFTKKDRRKKIQEVLS
jgi:ankyrin repeat protein